MVIECAECPLVLVTTSCLPPADQVDIHLLRCQQLRLYILKAGRALLSHQDKLRQILCQPAVVDMGPNPSGKVSSKEGLRTRKSVQLVFQELVKSRTEICGGVAPLKHH